MKQPVMNIVMANSHTIKIELNPQKAPNSVNGLIWAVQRHLFDHMPIQRIVPDFVLQPWYDEKMMSQDYQYWITGEFSANGYDGNDLSFKKYTVGLAGDGQKISSPSCFFIVIGDQCEARLNGHFAAIGEVISGFEEVERLAHVPLNPIPSPSPYVKINEPQCAEVIETVTLELNEYCPGAPVQFLPNS